jgi:hypothetical protein
MILGRLSAVEPRLSPLGHAHVNELGRYAFPVLASGAALRPLRDPHAADQQA